MRTISLRSAQLELQNQFDEQSQKLSEMVEENAAFNSKNLTLQIENKKLNEKTTNLEVSHQKLSTSLNAAKSQINSENSTRQVEQKKLQTLHSQIDEYSSKSEQLMKALNQQKSTSKTTTLALEKAATERDEAVRRLSTFDVREMDLVRKLSVIDDVRRSLHNRVMQLTGNIRVFVRVRPALDSEQTSIAQASEEMEVSERRERAF